MNVMTLNKAIARGYDEMRVPACNGPGMITYKNKSTQQYEIPVSIGEIMIMTGAPVRKPESQSWMHPYQETHRQSETPQTLVYHGTNIETLIPVLENGGIMQGGMKNWFASHDLEKIYHDNPQLRHEIQRPRDPAENYAKLGKFSRTLNHWTPIVLRFRKEQLPKLDVISTLNGKPEHYRTGSDVSLNNLTTASKCDVIDQFQNYNTQRKKKVSQEDYKVLAHALGFDDKNFFITKI